MSTRERNLLALFPAAVILAAYAFLVAVPLQKEIQSDAENLTTLKQTAVDKMTADNARVSLELARASLARLNERVTADRTRIKHLGNDWRDSETRLETVKQITEMLREFDLSVVNQQYETEPAFLSNYMRDLAKVIDTYSSDSPLEYWQIELEGRYLDVKRFLDKAQQENSSTFPISLSMNASTSSDGLHTWTIVFIV